MLESSLVNILLTVFSTTRSNYLLRHLHNIRDLFCSEQLLAKLEFLQRSVSQDLLAMCFQGILV